MLETANGSSNRFVIKNRTTGLYIIDKSYWLMEDDLPMCQITWTNDAGKAYLYKTQKGAARARTRILEKLKELGRADENIVVLPVRVYIHF